jgi:hypothetical protein
VNHVADVVQAAQRRKTKRSGMCPIEHFKLEYKGLLQASSEVVAIYLTQHAGTLSNNTLRRRLAALSRWRCDHGFADPMKDPLIRQFLKAFGRLIPHQKTTPPVRDRPRLHHRAGGKRDHKDEDRDREQQMPSNRVA